jgi:hypothetical protein
MLGSPSLLACQRTRLLVPRASRGRICPKELLSDMEGPMAGRDWVRAINKERRDDLGDCPTLPEELLELIKTDTTRGDEDWVRRFSSKRDGGPSATRASGG